MVILECRLPNCDFKTIDGSDAIVVAHVMNHNLVHQLTTSDDANTATRPRDLKLERPRIDMGVENETWNTFERRWDNLYHGSGIEAASASTQLFHCTNEALEGALLKLILPSQHYLLMRS